MKLSISARKDKDYLSHHNDFQQKKQGNGAHITILTVLQRHRAGFPCRTEGWLLQ